MAVTFLAIHDLATDVRDCVCQALTAAAAAVEGQPGCPCRACIVPGTAAWDSCDDPCGETNEEGGQLTVSVARTYPSSVNAFPAEDRTVRGVRGCTLPLLTAVEIVITVLRCVPMPDPQTGCPPSCETLEAAARVIHVDAAAVIRAMECCIPSIGTRRNGPRHVIGVQRFVGPEGGCAGVEQRVTVGLANCACPEESP